MHILKNLKYNIILLIIAGLLTSTSCTREPVEDPIITTLPGDTETQIRDFVWKAMNSWYLYQNEQDLLHDTRDDNIQDYVNFLQGYNTPEALFDALLYQPNIKDRFSFIVDDYEALGNQLQGISEDFGFDYQLIRLSGSSNDIIGFVRYVLPGTPAARAGLQRGDLFGKVDGKQLTLTNYQQLLFNNRSYQLGLINFNGQQFIDEKSVSLTAEIIHENPVYKSEIIEHTGGMKVGYLVLNGFNHLYHAELNAAFGKFKNAGVQELVLDLRYNPGGTVITAAMLGSMIYSPDTGKNFIAFDYNDKHSEENQYLNFFDVVYLFNDDFEVTGVEALNSLELDRVFILTSRGTASASEAIINGLNPYMNVVVIGEQTVGKNVGSRTLYDAPASDFTNKSMANPKHKYAIQPLTTKIINSVGFGEFEDGFTPEIEISELDYLLDIKPLGNKEEILLSTALNYLSPTRTAPMYTPSFPTQTIIAGPEKKSQNPFYRSLNMDFLDQVPR